MKSEEYFQATSPLFYATTGEKDKNWNMGLKTMKKRKRYTGSFKALVVVEYIKGEKTLDEIAEEYQVHPNQIKNWKSLLLKRAHEVLDDRRSREDASAEEIN